MFTGLRKDDILALTKAAIRNSKIWRRTSKTGQEVSIPIHRDLAPVVGGRVSDFDRLRTGVGRKGSRNAFLYAFDLPIAPR
jgi:hypothetical protein